MVHLNQSVNLISCQPKEGDHYKETISFEHAQPTGFNPFNMVQAVVMAFIACRKGQADTATSNKAEEDNLWTPIIL